MRSTLAIFLAASATLLVACNDDKAPDMPAEIEASRDVAYYQKNTAERDTMILKCKNDPAKYALNGNCINAERAKNKSVFSNRKGTGQVKALTAEEMFGSSKN